MEEELKSGISTNNQRPSELDIITNHSTSRVLAKQVKCKSGALTLDGSSTSNSKVDSLSILQTTRFLMFTKERMRKVNLLRFKARMEITNPMLTKDGRSSILIKLRRSELKASTKNSVSISIDHSTLDLECLCKELPNATELTTSG
jgi:hypothetical protein